MPDELGTEASVTEVTLEVEGVAEIFLNPLSFSSLTPPHKLSGIPFALC